MIDTQTEDYRWDRVEVGIRDIVFKSLLKKALDARAQLTEIFPRLPDEMLKTKNAQNAWDGQKYALAPSLGGE